jgi:GTP cyclohydrolase IB
MTYSKECLPDIQCESPNIHIPIQQVGVENVEVPFKLESKYGGFHQLNANVSMRTHLDKDTKGISMSRLLLTLKPYLDLPLKHKLIKQILEDLKVNVESIASYMRFEFRMPINRKSILSDNQFPIYYRCRFEGQLELTKVNVEQGDAYKLEDVFRFYQGVRIQYASYCPCSAELCSHLGENNSRGFPHNQRSFADILVEVEESNYLWLEDIIESVESRIKTLPYPVIKRVDEQEIARVAAENPMFVEDAIREISNVLNGNPAIHDWIVKCSHEESIHTSEAIAINWKGVPGGFSGKRYL